MLLRLSGPVIGLLGVLLGAWGTLLMCRVYHPFTTWRVLLHLFSVAFRYIVGDRKGARQELKDASEFAAVNQENKYRTLEGVYLLAFSFLVQTVGAALVIVDLLVHRTP